MNERCFQQPAQEFNKEINLIFRADIFVYQKISVYSYVVYKMIFLFLQTKFPSTTGGAHVGCVG